MTKHLFLTGVKGVGKSTLVQTLLGQYHGTLGGFYTKRITGVIPGVYSVHLLPADRPEPPSADNLLFCCGSAGRQAAAANFDRLGCAALARSAGAGLLVMDELGPHEAEARAFRAMVLAAVEGETPILGVLQQADSPPIPRWSWWRSQPKPARLWPVSSACPAAGKPPGPAPDSHRGSRLPPLARADYISARRQRKMGPSLNERQPLIGLRPWPGRRFRI